MRQASQIQLRDVLAILTIGGFMAALVIPALATLRENDRRRHCVDNLRRIGVALHAYHDAQGSLPPAAVWTPGPLRTRMLSEVKRIDLITQENWALLVLPYLGRSGPSDEFRRGLPVMAPVNEAARLEQVPEFLCPCDAFNRADNFYTFQPQDDRPPIARFARGNYAINGGTHSLKFVPEGTTQPHGDGLRLVLGDGPAAFKLVGNGVAGINAAFRLSDFVNGQSTLVAAEEIRAGIHPLDIRGVWALGQIGSSITWGHGAAGDDCGPNNQSERADDILGGGRLHNLLGEERLRALGMPCVSYVDRCQQATARSLHANGAHVLFMDGAVRFVGDHVSPGVWHVMHSRETPTEELYSLEAALEPEARPPDAAMSDCTVAAAPLAGGVFSNSAAMEFTAVPAGVFTMGLPDRGNDAPAPLECPPHPVRITRNFWLGRYEVSQRQFTLIMGRNPSDHQPAIASGESTAEFPVERVSWYDAVEFCRRLSCKADERAAGRRYRLPTEAEWEYACRAGRGTPYAWRPVRDPGDETGEAAGIEPSLPLKPVGSYPPNEFELCDMRGGVWEWCSDWFDRTYYRRSPRDDPQGPASGYLKVVRGSDWIFVGELCRINYPIMPPWKTSPFVGFRVVCEIKALAPANDGAAFAR